MKVVAELVHELLPGFVWHVELSGLQLVNDVLILLCRLHVESRTLLDANFIHICKVQAARHPREAASQVKLERELVDEEAVGRTKESIINLLLAV